jgi:threonine dehydrogenase-like Zn-dependent dehydrogenase
MRAAVFHGAGDIRVEQAPDPRIEQPTDAVVRITHAAICGSDLWPYRGINPWQAGWRIGHEWLGVVEEVGAEVQTVKRGDWVLAPFSFSDGTCEFCQKGLHGSCVQAGFWATTRDGGQGEAIRAPLADGTLVRIPDDAAGDQAVLNKMLLLTDVMATGHHAAVSAGVQRGGTVAVVGDGAVGLCGVLAAHRLGADRIIAIGHHADRLATAKAFGATDLVSTSGEEAVAEVKNMTNGGPLAVMECVGNKSSMDMAFAIARAGAIIGFVGQPHGTEIVNIRRMYRDNVGLRGGIAPVRAYIPELMSDVLAGTLDPSPVLDMTVSLDDISSGYAAMDTRQALKVVVRP